MSSCSASGPLNPPLPEWVPSAAQVYLAHTEAGLPIRALARASGCHASTILRQIRRVETQRDDPLVDAALKSLSKVHFATRSTPQDTHEQSEGLMRQSTKQAAHGRSLDTIDDCTLEAAAHSILDRLCEPGAVLAVATDMEKAVVVKDGAAGETKRTAVVDRAVAEAMALKDWITPKSTGRITRYVITRAGRAALGKAVDAAAQGAGPGFAEAVVPFSARADTISTGNKGAEDDSPSRRGRYNMVESPITVLARRRDKSGAPFLSDELVTVGERLREDFELAQMGPRVTQNWDGFLTAGTTQPLAKDAPTGHGPEAARQRVIDAMTELGPGLSDVVLRCCCYLEGLETAEKRLGWSARSGKIVLRIALMRLKRHYDETIGPGGPLIG